MEILESTMLAPINTLAQIMIPSIINTNQGLV